MLSSSSSLLVECVNCLKKWRVCVCRSIHKLVSKNLLNFSPTRKSSSDQLAKAMVIRQWNLQSSHIIHITSHPTLFSRCTYARAACVCMCLCFFSCDIACLFGQKVFDRLDNFKVNIQSKIATLSAPYSTSNSTECARKKKLFEFFEQQKQTG